MTRRSVPESTASSPAPVPRALPAFEPASRRFRDDADVVVVHDAARPLASRALFAAVVEAVRAGAPGAIPGVPVTDTVKRVRGAHVTETLDRNELVAVQTPQAFSVAVLRRAHAGESDATDDAALLELAGRRRRGGPGEATNRKLTELEDLAWFEQMLLQADSPMSEQRVGLGFDVHPFAENPDGERELVLGGVAFPWRDAARRTLRRRRCRPCDR